MKKSNEIVVTEVSRSAWEEAMHAQHVSSIPEIDLSQDIEALNAIGGYLASYSIEGGVRKSIRNYDLTTREGERNIYFDVVE